MGIIIGKGIRGHFLRGPLFRFIFTLLGAILIGEISLLSAQAKDMIRVLLVRDLSQVRVSGEGIALFDLKSGQTIFKNKRTASLFLERDAGFRVRIQGHSISAPGFWLNSSDGLLWINGRPYRDKFKVLPGPNRDLWVINFLPLEDYLVGLVNSEISSQWTPEAVKAQVIAARTYAIFQRESRLNELYDVDSGVTDQMYLGAGKEDARSRNAVQDTKGELLLYQGHPIFAVYSACCGGKTESAEFYWPVLYPYLRSIECTHCLDSPHFLWNYSIEGERLAKALEGGGAAGSRVLGLEVEERSPSRRVLKLTVRGERNRRQISGKDFRRLLGYDQLRSTNFIFQEKEGVFHFSGLGWGHGVGFCQWGAKGMAEAGADYRTLLKNYYRGVEIGKYSR